MSDMRVVAYPAADNDLDTPTDVRAWWIDVAQRVADATGEPHTVTGVPGGTIHATPKEEAP